MNMRWPREALATGHDVRVKLQAIQSGDAHLVFHALVYPKHFTTREDLLQTVRGSISSALPE